MTTKINLLPWRNALREQRKKAFMMNLALAGIVGALAVGGAWTYFSQQLSEQNDVNQMITQENAKLDEQLKALEGLDARRAQIEERMKLIEGLQGQRPVIVRVADELVRLIPQDLFITKFQRQGDKFTFEGRAQDPNIVAEFLRGLEMSPWFRNAFMNSYVAVDDARLNTVTSVLNKYAQSISSTNPDGAKELTSLLQRPEVKYGTFIVTVDLEQPKPVDNTEQPEPTDSQLPPQEVTINQPPAPAGQATPAGQPTPPATAGQPTPPAPAGQPAPPQPQQPVPAQQGQQGVPTTEPVAPPQPMPQPTGTPPAGGTPPAPANNPGVAK